MNKTASNSRWKQLGTLGQGGQGGVHLVEDLRGELKGQFAMKKLQKNAPAKALQRFCQEIEALNRIDHPYVIKVVDFDVEGNQPYYVMEHFKGCKSLRRLMRNNENPFYGEAVASLHMFRDLLSAIEAWCSRGILHRDLSPANILVLPDRSIKVIDFGICQMEGGNRVTLTDEGVGTKDYMAPECEPGSSESLQLHADVYSAGKILWSAVTNKAVFARESPAFNSHSMMSEFPTKPELWHLQRIFEVTIRRQIGNRFNVSVLANGLWVAEHRIRGRMLPEELAGIRCPHCFGSVRLVVRS